MTPLSTSQTKPHPVHYFEDGNVVFIVGEFQFRLLASMLTRKSKILKNIVSKQSIHLSDAKSISSEDDIDFGVPTIRLDDDAEDFAALLDKLMPPSSIPPPLNMERLHAVLRLSEKYGFDDVRGGLVKTLDTSFPHTLDHLDFDPELRIYADLATPAFLISAARSTDRPHLLTLAFYALATKEWADTPATQAALSILSPADHIKIHRGRAIMQKWIMARAIVMPENCMERKHCTNRRLIGQCAMGLNINEVWPSPAHVMNELLRDPLLELSNRRKRPYLSLCKPCAEEIIASSKSIRDELFSRLPDFFGLASQ
jgi:hypothetical protein